jgi:ankyrin repeat protein
MKHIIITTIAAVLVVGCGESPKDIWEAAKQGNTKAVKQHLDAGTDVDAKDDQYGGTPLHYAAMEGHMEIVELLITKGADVNAATKNGHTALSYTKLHPETAELLRKHGGKTKKELEAATPEPPAAKAPDISIHGAAMQGNIEAVKKHLAAGVDVNATSKMWSGMTPLHIAAEGGHNEIAELLIAKGADLTAKDQNPFVGGTPLDWAIKRGKNETAALLRKHGGKYSKIRFAARGGDIKAVKEFLAAGADVNTKDKRGDTPLDIAELLFEWESPEVKAAKKEMADLLRKHGGKTGEELKAEGK